MLTFTNTKTKHERTKYIPTTDGYNRLARKAGGTAHGNPAQDQGVPAQIQGQRQGKQGTGGCFKICPVAN